jgi:hypothetical protein
MIRIDAQRRLVISELGSHLMRGRQRHGVADDLPDGGAPACSDRHER